MGTGPGCQHVALETLHELTVLGRGGSIRQRWVRCLLCADTLHQEYRDGEWVVIARQRAAAPHEDVVHRGVCLGCGRALENTRKQYCSPQCARRVTYWRNREVINVRRRERYWTTKRGRGPE